MTAPPASPDRRVVRIFLSSPGDVVEERRLALEVIREVAGEFEEDVSLEPVAWDAPDEHVTIRATQTPQASIDAGLPRPSECDIVVTIFWARMGTPLPHPEYAKPDGEPYHSGSEWEFEDGVAGWVEHGRPEILLYRCTRDATVDTRAPDALNRVSQGQGVVAFFDRLRATRRRAFAEYATPAEFRAKLQANLRDLLTQQLIVWEGSPFPGLRAFTTRDAPIFFGRRRETDALVARLAGSRFVAVVGASGSGKSSLVGAGAIPRLRRDYPHWLLPSFDHELGHWVGLRLSPGEQGANPFLALTTMLAPLIRDEPGRLASSLETSPSEFPELVKPALHARDGDAQVLLFVDQFEELFTLVDAGHVAAFVELLRAAASSGLTRVVLTVRSDYYHRCVELPVLARLMEQGQLPLPAPSDTLHEMIDGPAARAGLRIDDGLAGRIVAEMGSEPGALPLLAYTLDELYRAGWEEGALTFEHFDELGGVRGAIGTRAETVFGELDEPSRQRFSHVFRELIEVEEGGRVARRRAKLATVAPDDAARRFVGAFTDARLLVTASDETGRRDPVVYVAHEALFSGWKRLREWIEEVRGDLLVLRRVELAAADWAERGRPDYLRWPHERLIPVYDALERLAPPLSPATADFIRPEAERWLPLIRDPDAPTHRVQAAADRLVVIGESVVPGLLDVLGDEHPAARNAAISALARLGPHALPHLIEVASSAEPTVQLGVLGALRQLGDASSIPVFQRALASDDSRVRSLAAGALRSIGGPGVVEAVTAALADERVDTRWLAAGVLGGLGAAAVPGLLTALADGDAMVRDEAREALQAVGEAALPQLLDAIRDPDPEVATLAAEGLLIVGAAAVPALVRVAGDGSGEVRSRAIETLAVIGDASAAPGLAGALEDDSVLVRRAAAEALLGLQAPAAMHALVAGLGDDDAIVRGLAAQALAALGHRAVEALAAALTTTLQERVRSLAAAALGKIGEAALPALLHAAGDAEPMVRHHATCALSRIGPPAVDSLVEMLGTKDDEAASAASTSLMDMGRPGIAALADQSRLHDVRTRRRIAGVLGGIGIPEAQPPLVDLLDDDDSSVRAAAAVALGRLGRPAIPALLRTLASTDEDVRAAAGQALIGIGGLAVPGLLAVCRDGAPGVAETAAGALRRIGTPSALLHLEDMATAV